MNKTEKATLWNELRPALVVAWAAWTQLYGFDADWEDQERALFDLEPGLYRNYRIGPTPAMEHGVASAAFSDYVGEYCKRWRMAVTVHDFERYMGVKVVPAGDKAKRG